MLINAHADIKIGNLLNVLVSSFEFSCLPPHNNLSEYNMHFSLQIDYTL